MYEYKAVQRDELSLRKGELYRVQEKCHDGWFKGTSLKTGQSGVFPGNYVKIYDQKQVGNRFKLIYKMKPYIFSCAYILYFYLAGEKVHKKGNGFSE